MKKVAGLFLAMLCFAQGASDETREAVSHFIDNMMHGRSRLFFGNSAIGHGRVVTDHKILAVREHGEKVTLEVQYHVIGTFRTSEADPTKAQISRKPASKERVVYNFTKQGKTYRLERGFQRVPYILESQLN